jgi:hypothetical protein
MWEDMKIPCGRVACWQKDASSICQRAGGGASRDGHAIVEGEATVSTFIAGSSWLAIFPTDCVQNVLETANAVGEHPAETKSQGGNLP